MSKIEEMEQKISEKVGLTFSTEEQYLFALMKIFADLHIALFFSSVDACRFQICYKTLAILSKEPETSNLRQTLCRRIEELFSTDNE